MEREEDIEEEQASRASTPEAVVWGCRQRPRNSSHYCSREDTADFIHIFSEHFSKLGRKFTANDELISATCGVDSKVLELIWFAYGGALRKAGLEPIDLCWALSRAQLNDPWIFLGRVWGKGHTQFQETCNKVIECLASVMDEVRLFLPFFR